MKYLILALLASTASAETVTLGTETCTRTQVCYAVPNSGGLNIEYISDASQYGRLIIEINGDIYDSGLYAYPNLANFTIYDAAGKPLSGSISLSIVVGSKCIQEGHVCVYPKTVTLTGGSLTL